jgi:hypothetical protein
MTSFFPRAARRCPSPRRATRRLDRAAVITTAVFQVIAEALRARHRDDDRSAIPAARLEIESLLRDEIADAQREAINEIRLHDE